MGTASGRKSGATQPQPRAIDDHACPVASFLADDFLLFLGKRPQSNCPTSLRLSELIFQGSRYRGHTASEIKLEGTEE